MHTIKRKIFLPLVGLLFCLSVIAQKKVAELTLVYDAGISTGDNKGKAQGDAERTTVTVYLKGTMSRSEMTSGLASFISIHDLKTGTGVVLQEISGQKLLIRMTADNWKDKNKRYENMSFSNTSDTKTIAGYKCVKATATLADGSAFTVFYTKDIIPENTDYNPAFKSLSGLPLEYELTQGGVTIRYTVSKINMNPVPASKFDIPKSGYRELTYEESRKLGNGG